MNIEPIISTVATQAAELVRHLPVAEIADGAVTFTVDDEQQLVVEHRDAIYYMRFGVAHRRRTDRAGRERVTAFLHGQLVWDEPVDPNAVSAEETPTRRQLRRKRAAPVR